MFDTVVKQIFAAKPRNHFALTFEGKKLAPDLSEDTADID